MNDFKYIEDFQGARKKAVGSSDIPILAGLFKRFGKTPLKLFWEKTGRADPWEGNEKTQWGHRLEPLILRKFIEDRGGHVGLIYNDALLDGWEIDDRGGFYEFHTECNHPKYPWALAHADMINIKDGFIVEAKSTGFFSAHRRNDADFGYDKNDLSENGIPASVFLQVQWQMLIYDLPVAWVAALIDTSDFRIYGPINENKRVQEKCLALAARFWDCVEADTPPEPQTLDDVSLLFPVSKKTTRIVSGDDLLIAREAKARFHKVGKKIKDLEAERDDIKNALAVLMGENMILGDNEGDTIAKMSDVSARRLAGMEEIKKKAPELLANIEAKGLIKESSYKKLTI